MSTHSADYYERKTRIIAVLRDRKIYAKEIAHALGLSPGYVQSVLTPHGRPAPGLLERIAAYLGITLS